MNDKKKDMRFIKTNSPETAKKLRAYGFTEIPEQSSNMFLFINDGKMVFEAELTDCVYTNKLCI